MSSPCSAVSVSRGPCSSPSLQMLLCSHETDAPSPPEAEPDYKGHESKGKDVISGNEP